MRSASFAVCAAIAVIVAGCAHGASDVAPAIGNLGAPALGSSADTIASDWTNSVPLCGPVPAGHARCFIWERTDIHGGMNLSPNSVGGLHPADLQAAYELPSATAGTGQTIALVDAFDNPNIESDLGVYRAEWGESACTTANGCFQKVNQYGQPSPLPSPDATGSWSVEEELDVDMASAICPNCKIILVEAKSNTYFDLAQGVMSAVRMGATAVSNSYGGSEQGTLGLDRYYKHRKAIITTSTGDSGYGVQFPASSPWVVAVGGTYLKTDPSTRRGWAETAWQGGGSGCSTVQPKPAWQSDPLCTMRMEVDTAADASPQSGVAVYDTFHRFGWIVEGGTSVASPIVAAVYELKGNASTADYGSRLYRTKSNHLWDVTSGSNGNCGGTYFCTAGPGYDGPTGMGTPHGDSAY